MFEKFLHNKAIWLLLSALLGIGLSACNAETPEEKQVRICRETPVPESLQTTISSDGKMIAVLSYVDNCGKKRLRYKNVDPQGPWQELPIGTGVDSIRFGLKGHELMLTRRVRPAVDSWSELYKVDLDRPSNPPKTLYEAYGLTHPVEISPDQIMVQNCVPTDEKKCHRSIGWQWDLVRDGKPIHRWPYGKQYGNMNYGWPNIVQGQGAFWFKVRGYYKEDEPYPDFWSLALPGKTLSKFSEPLDDETEDLNCDYRTERCFRTFIRNRRAGGAYIYDREVLWKQQRCQVEGVRGYDDDQSLTPDGLASVMSLYTLANREKRHVVIFKFSSQQCAPLSVEHIYLEEK